MSIPQPPSQSAVPAEIEGCINEMPGVAESAVVWVPHPDFGEVGVAVVIPRSGARPDPQALIADLHAHNNLRILQLDTGGLEFLAQVTAHIGFDFH